MRGGHRKKIQGRYPGTLTECQFPGRESQERWGQGVANDQRYARNSQEEDLGDSRGQEPRCRERQPQWWRQQLRTPQVRSQSTTPLLGPWVRPWAHWASVPSSERGGIRKKVVMELD